MNFSGQADSLILSKRPSAFCCSRHNLLVPFIQTSALVFQTTSSVGRDHKAKRKEKRKEGKGKEGSREREGREGEGKGREGRGGEEEETEKGKVDRRGRGVGGL